MARVYNLPSVLSSILGGSQNAFIDLAQRHFPIPCNLLAGFEFRHHPPVPVRTGDPLGCQRPPWCPDLDALPCQGRSLDRVISVPPGSPTHRAHVTTDARKAIQILHCHDEILPGNNFYPLSPCSRIISSSNRVARTISSSATCSSTVCTFSHPVPNTAATMPCRANTLASDPPPDVAV